MVVARRRKPAHNAYQLRLPADLRLRMETEEKMVVYGLENAYGYGRALVLINMLDKLPDAIPDDKYWTLG